MFGTTARGHSVGTSPQAMMHLQHARVTIAGQPDGRSDSGVRLCPDEQNHHCCQ